MRKKLLLIALFCLLFYNLAYAKEPIPVNIKIIKVERAHVFDWINIKFQLTNVSSKTIKQMKIYCILYDKNNEIVDYQEDDLINKNNSPLSPQNYLFSEIRFSHFDFEKINPTQAEFKIVSLTTEPNTDLNNTEKSIKVMLQKTNSAAENITLKQNPNKPPLIKLTGYEKMFLPENIAVGRVLDKYQITLYIKNLSDKDITAWKANLVAKDAFGDELFHTDINAGQSIPTGQTIKLVVACENNPLIHDEIFDKFKAYDKNNLELSLDNIEVIQK